MGDKKRIRARYVGTCCGEPWEFTDPENHPRYYPPTEHDITPNYEWSDGNWSCDCNRVRVTPFTPENRPELFVFAGNMYPDGSGPAAETYVLCGELICIDQIIPLDSKYPPVILDETKTRKFMPGNRWAQ